MYIALVALSLLVLSVSAAPAARSKEIKQKVAAAEIVNNNLDGLDVSTRKKYKYVYPRRGYGYPYPYPYEGYPYGYYYPGGGYRYGYPYGY